MVCTAQIAYILLHIYLYITNTWYVQHGQYTYCYIYIYITKQDFNIRIRPKYCLSGKGQCINHISEWNTVNPSLNRPNMGSTFNGLFREVVDLRSQDIITMLLHGRWFGTLVSIGEWAICWLERFYCTFKAVHVPSQQFRSPTHRGAVTSLTGK